MQNAFSPKSFGGIMSYTAHLIETNSKKVENYFTWGDSIRTAQGVLAGEQDGTRMVVFGDSGLAAYQVRGGAVVRHEVKTDVNWDLLGVVVCWCGPRNK